MKAARTSEPLLNFYLTTWRSVPTEPSIALIRKHSTAVQPNLSTTHGGTLQYFAPRKENTKIYMATNVCLHTNSFPIRIKAYETKTQHLLNKIINDKSACVCVCVCLYYELLLRKIIK